MHVIHNYYLHVWDNLFVPDNDIFILLILHTNYKNSDVYLQVNRFVYFYNYQNKFCISSHLRRIIIICLSKLV